MWSVLKNKPSLPPFYVCATSPKWAGQWERRGKSELPAELGEVIFGLCFLPEVFVWNKLCWPCLGTWGDELQNVGEMNGSGVRKKNHSQLNHLVKLWRSWMAPCWSLLGRTGRGFLGSRLSFWLIVCVPGCFLPASCCAYFRVSQLNLRWIQLAGAFGEASIFGWLLGWGYFWPGTLLHYLEFGLGRVRSINLINILA